MVAPYYSWVPSAKIITPGYPGEEVNTIPANPIATTSTATTGSATYKCFYRDSAQSANCSSTRVVVTGHDEWEVEVGPYNNLIVKVHTVLDSITRDDKIETCGSIHPPDGIKYDMIVQVGRERGGQILWKSGNWYYGDLKTAVRNYDIGAYTFIIPPGGDQSITTLYVQNDSAYFYDRPEDDYHDRFEMGIKFTNLLPKIYRPGDVWNGSAYVSHNRSNGARNLWTGAYWKECTTQSGPTGSNDAPTIWNGDRNQNMRLIGQQ